jgi:hypothetical protein
MTEAQHINRAGDVCERHLDIRFAVATAGEIAEHQQRSARERELHDDAALVLVVDARDAPVANVAIHSDNARVNISKRNVVTDGRNGEWIRAQRTHVGADL